MGTRADFYVGKGKEATWLGSIAFDGYPEGIHESVLKSTTEGEFKYHVEQFLLKERSATLPKQGWPWPWEDSQTTDYSYWFFDEKAWASCFGSAFFDPLDPDYEIPEGPKIECPEFGTDNAAIAGSDRSGIMAFRLGGD